MSWWHSRLYLEGGKYSLEKEPQDEEAAASVKTSKKKTEPYFSPSGKQSRGHTLLRGKLWYLPEPQSITTAS